MSDNKIFKNGNTSSLSPQNFGGNISKPKRIFFPKLCIRSSSFLFFSWLELYK